jgi:hypothetical protein
VSANEPRGGISSDDGVDDGRNPADATDPLVRARAGGWTGEGLEAPPHYCDDEGGTEWCEGHHDDDCDGIVDEGCVDCQAQRCVRYEISDEEMRRGTGKPGPGECVGPVYCGRVDGVATTSPPGGCGAFHCGTLIFADRTARPYYCTISGRCDDGEFIPEGFSW